MSTSSAVGTAHKIFEYLRSSEDLEPSAQGSTLGARKAAEAMALALGDDFEVSTEERKAVQEGVRLFLAESPSTRDVSREALSIFEKYGIQVSEVTEPAVPAEQIVGRVLELARKAYAGHWGQPNYVKETVDALMFFHQKLSPADAERVVFEVGKFNTDLALYIAGQPSNVKLV